MSRLNPLRLLKNKSKTSIRDQDNVSAQSRDGGDSVSIVYTRDAPSDSHGSEMPPSPALSQASRPTTAASSRRRPSFNLFRTKSKQEELVPHDASSLRSQGERSVAPLGDATQFSAAQKTSRGPFSLFRKKSRQDTHEPLTTARKPDDHQPSVVALEDAPSRAPEPHSILVEKPKKNAWKKLFGKKKKPQRVVIDPMVHEEFEEPYRTRSNSPSVERLSLDPGHRPDYEDSIYSSGMHDRPPPVIDLMAQRPVTPPSEGHHIVSPGPVRHANIRQAAIDPNYRPTSPPTSILSGGGSARYQPLAGPPPVAAASRQTGVTHVFQDQPSDRSRPQHPVYNVVHEDGPGHPPTQIYPGNPTTAGNYRISVRGDDTAAYPYEATEPVARAVHPGGPQISLKPGDEFELPPDGNVVFVVDDDIQLEIGNPETGIFVPYNEQYIAEQAAHRQEAYEETYFVPAGKYVEFQDEHGHVLHRTGGPKSASMEGLHDLGNGIQGGYDADGSYLIQVGGPDPKKKFGVQVYTGEPQSARSDAFPATQSALGLHSYVPPSRGSSPTVGYSRPVPSSPPQSSHHSGLLSPPTRWNSPLSQHSGLGAAHDQLAPGSPAHSYNPSPPQSPAPSSPQMFQFKPLHELLAAGLGMALKRNHFWHPHGPMDYARSARKWNLSPTDYTAFYTHDNGLFHRAGLMDLFDPGTRTEGAPTGVEGDKLAAEDVQNDLEYVVPVTVGTPGVTVNLDFDTGSADLWVWSTLLHASAKDLEDHDIYDPTRSSTSQLASGLTWKISYGDGSGASGVVYNDTIKFNSLVIHDQAVEVANYLSSAFLGEHSSDGLMGLAFPTINTVKPHGAKTPMEQLIEKNTIDQPIFCAKLDKGGEDSFYTFGYIPRDVLPSTSHISYVDVDSSNGFWEFPSPQLRVGHHTVQRPSGNTAIADTGTTLILIEDSSIDDVYAAVPGARMDNSGWILPTDSNPPDISFAAGSHFYTISGEDLKFSDAGHGMSFGAIQSRGQNKQDIFGDVFLKRVLTVFDQTPGRPRIGFGQRSLSYEKESSSKPSVQGQHHS